MKTRTLITAMACACLLLVQSAFAKVPGPLVDTAWLSANKDNVLILDVRKDTKSFTREGHIPGSVLVPWKDVRSKKVVMGKTISGMLPSREQFNALMQKLGADNDSSIVIVTRGHNAPQVNFGTRLYWQLKYYGHDDVAMLDGGFAQWVKDKRKISHEGAKAPAPGNFMASAERTELLATTADVEKAVADKSATLFDARGYDQYLGLFYKKKILTEGGHIPGGKFAAASTFLAHGNGPKTFAPTSLIKKSLAGLGADQEAITFCNTGHMASGLWFVMHELGGNDKARLYDGSMHAWTTTGHPAVAMKPE
ncbi:MAG TPA: sulfurtransferase [Sedimenticola thiotaurini]|uniref:Sulfurtransferase n=1 Tax=Sedimenticola thiotaurini TaxID=1543721 RepID=A0A831RLB1_9GAMM|nr:sulfurtransferase [Sedimenticola thiotaurini]